MTLNNAQPIFDLATHYWITVQGRVEVEWLQNFNSSAEIIVDETRQTEDITVLNVHTDQSGIVGLVRMLHGLGKTILQLQIVSDEGKPLKSKNKLTFEMNNKSSKRPNFDTNGRGNSPSRCVFSKNYNVLTW